MSFRDNLQHLRSTRNMTQEQLAMLLGVSRQSVTKWEAEKSYPEMDKLIKICQIFGCTLDDLVTGDLTARAAEPAASVPAGPPTDVCGYDERHRKLAWQVPTGIACIIAGSGVGLALEGAGALVPGGDADALMLLCILVGVLAGLAFLIPAGMEYTAFNRAHPYIEDFYTEEDRLEARRGMARGCIIGIADIFLGVIALVATDKTDYARLGMLILMMLVAAGVWSIVHFGMLLGRTNIGERNREIADDLEIEDIVSAQVDDEVKRALMERKRSGKKVGAICGAIMIVATIVGLGLLFAPVLTSPDPSDFDPAGTSAMWFWLAWPVGGLVCGIVALLMDAFGSKDA